MLAQKGESAVAQRLAAIEQACQAFGVVVMKREVSFSILQIVPSDAISRIDKLPKMPPLDIEATVNNSTWSGIVNYFWEMTINWVDPLGKLWSKEFNYADSRESRLGIWHVNWGDKFVGGDNITIESRATFAGNEYEADSWIDKLTILGNNPDKADVVSGVSEYQRGVIYQESKYRHFTANGFPSVNVNIDEKTNKKKSADYGLMQINTINNPGLLQVWNWTENKKRGLKILSDFFENASAWPGRIRNGDNWSSEDEYSEAGYRGCPESFPADSVMLIWKETYRRYNGGNLRSYWTWTPTDKRDPDKGGNWKRIEHEGRLDDASKYADAVWQNIQNHPNDW
jgi:hypothetical protein